MMHSYRAWLGCAALVLSLAGAGAVWSYPPPDEPSQEKPADEKSDETTPPHDARSDEFPPPGPEEEPPGDRRGPGRRGERRGPARGDGEPRMEGGPARQGGDRPHPGDRLRRAEGPGPRELSPEQIEQFLKMMQEYFPRKHEQLVTLRSERPAEFQRQMRRMTWLILNLLDADPEMRKLMIQDMRLEQEIREAREKFRSSRDPAMREQIAAQLRDLLSTQFDVRIQKSGRLIAGIERRLAEQKRLRDERIKNKSALVEKRLKDLTGQDGALKWPD